MKNVHWFRLAGAIALSLFFGAGLIRAADDYVPGPDSKPQDGVPKGDLIKFTFTSSKIFPGTTREVTIYVPKQYDPAKPACLHVNQDGVQWNAPVVFDNLIARGEMPVTIGVFVTPGIMKALQPATALDRYNRSYEYDGLGDAYARFLLDELLPEVEKKTLPDGRPIRISSSPNDRAIAGQSSGAICAFNVAWERPDSFRRVFSAIGTFVGLRGGDRISSFVRKFEPKPIRIFLQDGENDNNKYGGDWWMANLTLNRALTFAGYEVNHEWGHGSHSGNHATAIFPDVVRWLWKDWPKAVEGKPTGNDTLAALLIPGEGWQLVGEGYGLSEGAAVNAKGEVFFTDIPASKSFKISLDGRLSVFATDTKRANGQAFGPDGRLYSVASGAQQIIAYDNEAKPTVIAEGIAGNDLVVARNGNIYVTNPPPGSSNDPSKIWLLRPGQEKQVVDTGVKYANGIALSPDQSLLYVADYRSHWVYSYQVQADGTLANKQRFYWLHDPDGEDQSFADGLKVDREGRLYVATRLGIQVSDQPGKVQCIIPTPNGRITNLVFGGLNFDTLYATCNDKVYKRKLKVQGANAWDEPNKPAVPRL